MFRVQPVCVKLWKKVFGRWNSSISRSAPRPVATATTICVIQSGCAGQPGTLMTGRPDLERHFAPSAPPGLRLRNCSPCESLGLGAVAGMPPQVAQSPIATTYCAAADSSLTPLFHRPPGEAVPFAGAVGSVHHRALEDEYIEGNFPGDAIPQELLQIVTELHAERGVPQDVDSEVGDQVTRARFFGVQERHGVARTGPTLQHNRFATIVPLVALLGFPAHP